MAGHSPCASCKLLRRRCAEECPFAPYFPADDPHKFAMVHKVFGASNIAKMLQELPVDQRADAVSSLVYEANARVRDPVYGCVGAISYLQNQVSQLQTQLAIAQAEILCIQMRKDHHLQQQQPQHLLHGVDDDDFSFLLLDNDHLPLPRYLNFNYSSANVTLGQESLTKDSHIGHHDYIMS